MDFKFETSFVELNKKIVSEKAERESLNKHDLLSYPLACLNDFLFGIARSELVVIGSDTGIGKSQIANSIAKENGLLGKKVFLISLEGDRNEVVRRWIWEEICKEYYKDPTGLNMNFLLFCYNQIPGLEKFYEKAVFELERMKNNVFIYDKTSNGFTAEDLILKMGQMDQADLIIIDHLHYFSMFDDRSEASQISDIMRKIKEITEIWGIPVVLISHLRKKEKKRGMPDNEDFMGSSNIAKVATTTILLSSDPENNVNNLYSTLIRIGKNRFGHPRNIGFRLMFDRNTNTYLNRYLLEKMIGRDVVSFGGREKYPQWCKDLIGKTDTLSDRMDEYKAREGGWDE